MGLAENQLSFDLLERWLYEHPNASICTEEGVPNFREIVNYQDYHGLPNCRKAIGMFMEEVRGRKAKFDTERIVLTAGATAAHEVLAFCLADPGFWNFCHAGRSAVAVVLLMEYAKENAKCIQCEGNKELYASQCRHLDPICITCATNMAKDKTPCPTCHQVFTKIFRQNKLKPCPDGDTNKFLAKFPPKLSDSADFMGAEKQNADNKYFRKSDKRKWIMYREGAEDKRNKSKIATRPWILENVMDKKKYKGKAKPVDNKMYYMVQFDYKRMSEPLVVYPIKSWYEFETEIQYKTLTTEEAENIMKSRKKNEEGYAKWISNEKMKKDEMEDADENDETRKQKQLKKRG